MDAYSSRMWYRSNLFTSQCGSASDSRLPSMKSLQGMTLLAVLRSLAIPMEARQLVKSSSWLGLLLAHGFNSFAECGMKVNS